MRKKKLEPVHYCVHAPDDARFTFKVVFGLIAGAFVGGTVGVVVAILLETII